RQAERGEDRQGREHDEADQPRRQEYEPTQRLATREADRAGGGVRDLCDGRHRSRAGRVLREAGGRRVVLRPRRRPSRDGVARAGGPPETALRSRRPTRYVIASNARSATGEPLVMVKVSMLIGAVVVPVLLAGITAMSHFLNAPGLFTSADMQQMYHWNMW